MGRDIGTTETGGYNLRVQFANAGNQPITRVVFALNNGKTVVDAGTFAPGVMIKHEFDLAPTNAGSCHVESVTFADGTQWNAD
jgi:Haemolysin-type calcium binding protein related domain